MSREGSAVTERTLADGRFVLRALLGTGSFGEVYRAFDRRESRVVALKLLHKGDPDSIARFKREFRSVAEVHHPNLVRLHELHREGSDHWFFTMELVDGWSLDEWVRPGGEVDERRLDDAFAQIVRGLGALHASGHVHRDVKPSNVRVTGEGRVVVLDFGLAAEVDRGSVSKGIFGTPDYIAPELTEGANPTPASDWYGLGVMLFALLEGRLPFEGRPIEVLVDKRTRPAPAIDHRLGPLVGRLLARDPELRPDAATLRTALEGTGKPPQEQPRSEPPFVGRGEDLEWLSASFELARAGKATTRWIEGDAGAGKSALLRRFVATLPGDAMVLEGRCYERESVPYKGIDTAIDRLAKRLTSAPSEELRAIMPDGLPSLITLFPVLARVSLFARAGRRPIGFERQQLRAEAFEALRDLLTRLARRRPVVIVLDDLQWGDRDGAALLAELLSPPHPVPMLFVGAFRSASRERVAWLGALAEKARGETRPLAALTPDESRRLARSLLRTPNESREASIARAAGGNPLLVEMLSRFGTGGDGLTGAVDRSMEGLDKSSRRLLQIVCLAGQPVPREVAETIAGARLESLRGRHVVRVAPDGRVEAYHDRIREAVVAAIATDDRIPLHTRLAEALAEVDGDPEAIAHHYHQAGRASEAREWTLAAAQRAEATLAWERAARLYRRALDLSEELGRVDIDLLVSLGDALGHAGHGADADAAYRRALPAARRGEGRHAPVDLLRRSAEHLLRIGRMDDGVAALDEALGVFGMRLPSTPRGAVAALLAERARLRLRGLSHREQCEEEVDPQALAKIDLCWGAGVGLSMMDSLRGASLLTRSLRLALNAGEPYRIARSMAYEASFHSNQGTKGETRAKELVRRTAEIAERLDDAHLRALVSGAQCLIEFHNGRWRRAAERGREAENVFRTGSVGMVKEISTVQLLGSAAQLFLGELGSLEQAFDLRLRGAVQRGDLFTQANLRSGFLNALWLAKDDPERARAEADAALRDWDPGYYIIQRFFDLWARTQIELYLGDGVAAAAQLRTGYSAFRGSLLTRLQFLRASGWDLEGRVALARAADADDGTGLGIVHKNAARLAKEGPAYAAAMGLALEAGAYRLAGDHAVADARLAEAIVRYDDADMGAHTAAARIRRGEWVGGSRGEALIAEGRAFLESQGVVRVDRWTRMLFPSP